MLNGTNGLSEREYVRGKLARLESLGCSFASLFELMFDEKDNVMFESNEAFTIKKTTYGQVRDRILRRSTCLAGKLDGIAKGGIVGLYMDNSSGWIEMFWSIILCGFRPLLMNTRLPVQVLETALGDCGASAVVSDSKEFSLRTIWESDVTSDGGIFEPSVYGEEFFVMSSGTSNHVKLCAYGAKEMCAQIRASEHIILGCRQMRKGYKGDLKLLTFLPFYHIFGLVAVYFWFAFFGRTFVLLKDLSPVTIQNTIRRHKVTHVFAVPLFWERAYDTALRKIKGRGKQTYDRFLKGMEISGKLGDVPLLGKAFRHIAFSEIRDNMFGDSIRFMITGGSEIRSEVIRFFNLIGYHLSNGYGMSEVGITAFEQSLRVSDRAEGKIGVPIKGVDFCLNEDGTLVISGETLAKYVIIDGCTYYLNGRYETGDHAVCENGRYSILGRNDDLVITSTGENLSPAVIEDMVRSDGIRQTCLVKNKTGGATLLVSIDAYIGEKALADIRKRVARVLSDNNAASDVSDVFYTTDSLLEEDEFKLNRRLVSARYEERRYSPVKADNSAGSDKEDNISIKVKELLCSVLGCSAEEKLSSADIFMELGGTSLDYFALSSQIEDEFGIPLVTEDAPTFRSADEISDYIRDRMRDVS